MPELPEVQHLKEYLDATALHQKIKTVDDPKGCGKVSKTEISGRATYFCKEVQGEG